MTIISLANFTKDNHTVTAEITQDYDNATEHYFCHARSPSLENILEEENSVWGRVDFCIQSCQLFPKRRWIKVTQLENKTIYQTFPLKGVGTTMMEIPIVMMLNWEFRLQKGIKLLSSECAIFFYWQLGFRPDPANNFILLDSDLKAIYEALIYQEELSKPQVELFEQRKSAVSQKTGISKEELTLLQICGENLTELLQGIYDRAVAAHQKPDATGMGAQFLSLPECAWDQWKWNILSSPKLTHPPKFLNQLLLEKLQEAPDNIQKLVVEYSL